MASHESAKKSIRKTQRQRNVNISRINRIRTFVKKVETLIADGKTDGLQEAFSKAQSELMRGVTKGVLHKGNASRKISRMAWKIKRLSAED